jgi:hypothetical protein
MFPDQEALVKGVQLHRRINELSNELAERNHPQARVILSPELFFALLEYTVLMNETNMNRELLLWELCQRDELFFDTGTLQLKIGVDFFAQPNSICID